MTDGPNDVKSLGRMVVMVVICHGDNTGKENEISIHSLVGWTSSSRGTRSVELIGGLAETCDQHVEEKYRLGLTYIHLT